MLLLLTALALSQPAVAPSEADSTEDAAPGAEPAAVDRASERQTPGLPGTVDRPIRLRISKTSVEKANQTLQREWGKVERALLDLQASLYGETDRASRSVGIEPGKPLRVRVDRDLEVHIEVVEGRGDERTVKLRVEDAEGEPVTDIERATVQEATGAERELELAGAGEVVIHDLQYAEGSAVRLYIGDGDVILIWIEEDEVEDQDED